MDVVLIYSVLHYVYEDQPLFGFIDAALKLLAPGGEMLIGDIPNISKRKRFFDSDAGIDFHQAYTESRQVPTPQFNVLEPNKIDDSVILSIIMHARAAGFDAYLLPQGCKLPMANRREDILIRRP